MTAQDRPETAVFGLDDRAPGARAANGSRELRLHMMYVRQARRYGVACGFIFGAADVGARDGWTCAALR